MPKLICFEQDTSTRVVNVRYVCVLTVRRAGNIDGVVMGKGKAASFLPPYRSPIPHPLGFGKYVANSVIDCCDNGARGERTTDDKTWIAIT